MKTVEEIVKAKWPKARAIEHYSGDCWIVIDQARNNYRFPPSQEFALSEYCSTKQKAWQSAAARIQAERE